jgi:uncharacterized protein involved in exopolysaccharide biosynthesis
MGILKKHLPVVITILTFVLGALIYDVFAPEQYEVMGRVVVHRSQIEAPNLSTEESKNRWIWVRDGYAIKDSLLSQDLLSSILERSALLRDRFKEYLGENDSQIRESMKRGLGDGDLKIQFLAEFRRAIDVDYLGGDAFTYVITVKDKSPVLAKEVVGVLVDRLRALVVEETKASYDRSLAALQAEIRSNTTPEIRAHLAETYRGVLSSRVLFMADSSRRVEVVQAPSIPLTPIWPKIDRLLILAAVAGLAIGLLLEYVLAWTKQHALEPA